MENQNVDTPPTKEQQIIIDRTLECVANKRNVMLHAPGGTGKSWLMKRIASKLRENGCRVYVTATTGVAAVGLSDAKLGITASTLHRFAGVGTATLTQLGLINKVQTNVIARKRWLSCQVLIIDEISMLGGELFQKLCGIAKAVRKRNEPFGGILLIVGGDFLQLPPVKDSWIFQTDAWAELNIRPFILETPYRYQDPAFFEMLLRIRKGELTSDDYKILLRRVRANVKMHELLATLTNVNPSDIIRPTMLFSKRCDVDAFNQQELEKLPGKLVEFKAVDTFVRIKTRADDEDYAKMLDLDMARSVFFKVGAQVMLKVNLSPETGLVNGSRGVVREIVKDEAMVVKFLSGTIMRVDFATRTIEDDDMIATRVQIPFILAYALTLHKVQGSTLDYAIVDLGPSIFAEGQSYVALSRCKNVQGLFISEFAPNSIMANNDAVEYSETLEKNAKLEDAHYALHGHTKPIIKDWSKTGENEKNGSASEIKKNVAVKQNVSSETLTIEVLYEEFNSTFVKSKTSTILKHVLEACCDRYRLIYAKHHLEFKGETLNLYQEAGSILTDGCIILLVETDSTRIS